MEIEVLKSKIHRVTVTEANLNYIGSITLDEDLMDAADIVEYEKVQVLNLNNGERLALANQELLAVEAVYESCTSSVSF